MRCAVLLVGWIAFFLVPIGSGAAVAESPAEWAVKNVPQLLPLYEHLHCHPELSLQEVATAKRLADELRRAGAEVTTEVGGHGVVGVLANGEGPRLLLRTDMDALPIVERTGLKFASAVETDDPNGDGKVGVMHACGHDLHMTNLVGVARFLASHRDQWRGTVVFIGQPAEERVAGAKAMLNDGLYQRFGKPDFALALHVSTRPTGKIGYHPGFALANVDSADITVRGVGGHGAAPHTTVDPIVQAAQLVMALQTIVSREIDPVEPAVVTVGSIHGGTKHNIIADQCHLQLTIRSYSQKVRSQLHEAIRRQANGIAMAAGAPQPTVAFSEGTDAVYNDPKLVARVLPALRTALGNDNVVEAPPVMGAEDFGLFARDGVPIFMFWLDSLPVEKAKQLTKPMSLHSPFFYPDPGPTLITGITAMSSAALELLRPRQ